MLNYNVDILEKSKWKVITPSVFAVGLPFYVSEIGHFYCKENYFTERSNQNNYFIMYTVSGCGSLKYEDDNDILLTPGNAILIDCQKYHYYKSSGNEIWNYRWIHFSGESIQLFYNQINERGVAPVTISNKEIFEEYFDFIYNSIQSNSNISNIKISGYLGMMLTILSDDKLAGSDTDLRINNDIGFLMKLINKKYMEKLTVDMMANEIHLSKFHLIKLFKKYTGFTPYDYLITVRINNAKQLLKNSDLTIHQISEEVGFNDESSFISKFKKITGFTPLSYRRKF